MSSNYLPIKTPRVPILYLVPKIHKGLDKPPGRPIVSGVDSIFQPLAVYLDGFLQKAVSGLPCCLKDTGEFLTKIRNIDIGGDTFLCTLDVKSLYTNIPYREGTEAIRNKLCERADLTNAEISFLMSLLDIILTKNYFRFGDEHYLPLWHQALQMCIWLI